MTGNKRPQAVPMVLNPSAKFGPAQDLGYNPDSFPDRRRELFGEAGGGCTPTFTSSDAAYFALLGAQASFVSASQTPGTPQAAAVAQMGMAQHSPNPFAAVLCCADSRVGAEALYGQGLRNLFVVRNAGNIVDDSAIASLEYAVLVLGVQLVLVLSHDNCGAVALAAKAWSNPSMPQCSPAISSVVQSIVDTTFDAPDLSTILAPLKSAPTDQSLISQGAMCNAQAQAALLWNSSTILQQGSHILWAHSVMVQPGVGDQSANGSIVGSLNGQGTGAMYYRCGP